MKLKVSIFVNYVTLMFYLKVCSTSGPRKIVADFHKHQIQ